MSFFGKNIKKIRKVKKINQKQFAELFDLTRSSVGAYEEGRAEPRIETAINIANYFSISLEHLLVKELTINDIYNFDIFREDALSSHKSREGLLRNNILVPYLENSRVLDYLSNMKNIDFLEHLPYMSLPFPSAKIDLAYEHDSHDMVFNERGIYPKDVLLCRKIAENYTVRLSFNSIYLIFTSENVFLRRVVEKGNTLVLVPDNPNYESLHVPTERVRQIWKPQARLSRHIEQMANPALMMNELNERITGLEEKIKKQGEK